MSFLQYFSTLLGGHLFSLIQKRFSFSEVLLYILPKSKYDCLRFLHWVWFQITRLIKYSDVTIRPSLHDGINDVSSVTNNLNRNFETFIRQLLQKTIQGLRAPDKMRKLTSIDSPCVVSSSNPMFDHLLELSQWDDSNKWSDIGFGEKKTLKK